MSSVWSGILPMRRLCVRFHEGVVGHPVAADLIAVQPVLLSFFFQTAADIVPEINGSLEFLNVVISESRTGSVSSKNFV